MRHIAVIVNPVAGGGRAARRWRRARRLLEARDVRLDVSMTREHGHASVLVQEALARGHHTVVAVGGDGTVHEVLNGMMQSGKPRDDVRLGVIPAGTGMDFHRNLGARPSIRRAVEAIALGRERRIDVGIAQGDVPRAFANFAEVGLGAAVVAREARFGPAWRGRASFFAAAVEAAIAENNIGAGVHVDGENLFRGLVTSVVIANGQYFGGGMRIAPSASNSDGLLDVVVLGDFSRLERLTQIWKIYPGVHLRHRKVLWKRGTAVRVEPEGRAYLDLDGELYTDRPYRFCVLPSALRVLI